MNPDSKLRTQLRVDIPVDAFQRRPYRLALGLFPASIIIAGSATIILCPLPWYAVLLMSCFVGNAYGSLMFFGHELAHGAMIRSRHLQNVLLYPCFLIFCLSPHLWRIWHHAAHHAKTNTAAGDPDHFGTLEEYRRSSTKRFLYRFAPGSGHWLSIFYLFMFFTLQAQQVLWVASQSREFRRLRKWRAATDSILMLLFWISFGALLPGRAALFAVVLPMLIANFVVLAYVVTNHAMMPLSNETQVMKTTMGVTTLPFLDSLHFHFSHHVEHHLFPTMSSEYYPLVRRSLRRHAADSYLAPPHWTALIVLFKTPRLYDDSCTLIDPVRHRRFKISRIRSVLRGNSARRAEINDGC